VGKDILMQLTDIKDREDLPNFLNQNNLINEGVEVGVENGNFSRYILTHWNGKLLYSVDCWEQDSNFNRAKMRLSKFKDRSMMIREESRHACNLVDDNSLDFVYIDANHEFKHISNDIKWWWSKIKTNGVLCGHDYGEKTTSKGHPFGVIRAVDSFVKTNKLSLHVDCNLHEDSQSLAAKKLGPFPGWYINKLTI